MYVRLLVSIPGFEPDYGLTTGSVHYVYRVIYYPPDIAVSSYVIRAANGKIVKIRRSQAQPVS